jgi:foldase protein PrsA
MIGGKSITRTELADRLLSSYGADVLREMMLHEAVSLAAAELGLSISSSELERELVSMREGYAGEDQYYAAMQKQLGMDREAVREDAKYRLLEEKLATQDVRVSDADIASYYKEHDGEFGPQRKFELAWIVTAGKDEADTVLVQLEQGADFGMLAGRYSIDEVTAETGGYLGWVDDRDSFQDPRVLLAAARLKSGEAAGPLKTDLGYAVVQLRGTQTTSRKPLSSVKEDIRRQLALEQAMPIRELEQKLLDKYNADVLDPRLSAAEQQ